MKMKMKFQTKLITVYAVFMSVVAIILGFTYYRYTLNQYKENEKKNIEVNADQLVSQFDEIIKPMELVTQYILSDTNILTGIRVLANTPEVKYANRYIEEAKLDIQLGINTDYITSHFYRTIVFNQNGNVITSYNPTIRKSKDFVDYENMPWLIKASEQKGKPILVNTHGDTWGLENNPQVFSLLKSLQGDGMGYIEIQKKIDDLDKELQVSKSELEYMIFINDRELLYSTMEIKELDPFIDLLEDESDVVKTITLEDPDQEISSNYYSTEKFVVGKSKSGFYQVKVLVLEREDVLVGNTGNVAIITFLIALVFFSISLAFIIMLSRYVTKPIRQMQVVMEHTRLENLGEEISVDSTNDEIEALSLSYQGVLNRLQRSIVKEKRMSLLQLQAQFDALQAQVNPHFLYNTLNIISARGMKSGDEMICDICASLASMLRYSTNTKIRYASIADELGYLDQYFYLIKSRYEHKITYHVEIDKKIYQQIVPKLILQQIVENCINHGFEQTTSMEILITGWAEQGVWYISVKDNGQGFGEDILESLKKKLAITKRRIFEEQNNMELEIGGMGIVNIYAQLLLLYYDNLIFQLNNHKSGAEVVFGGNIRNMEKEEGDD